MSHHLKANSLALLTEQASLTERLKTIIGAPPVLTCRIEGRARVNREEQQILAIRPRKLAHVREITMGTQSANWLFARTVIPTGTLRHQASRLSKMRDMPLGKILFGQLRAKRTQMRLDIVFANEVGLEEFGIAADFPLWQRRSIFELKTGQLLITEIFLPDCPVYEYA